MRPISPPKRFPEAYPGDRIFASWRFSFSFWRETRRFATRCDSSLVNFVHENVQRISRKMPAASALEKIYHPRLTLMAVDGVAVQLAVKSCGPILQKGA
jgi:hypothetical protein